MITERQITYRELRSIVLALYDIGDVVKSMHSTFSHGSIRNELQDIARYLDKFVADLEPRHVLILQNSEDIMKQIMETDDRYKKVRLQLAESNERWVAITKALETEDLPLQASLDVIEDLRANFRPKVKKKRK